MLLSEKFDFADKNIKILVDEQGTAKNILGEFKTLIEKAGDYKKRTGKEATVVFHFSGHGSYVDLPDGVKKADEPDDKDETLVTVDSRDPAGKISTFSMTNCFRSSAK